MGKKNMISKHDLCEINVLSSNFTLARKKPDKIIVITVWIPDLQAILTFRSISSMFNQTPIYVISIYLIFLCP